MLTVEQVEKYKEQLYPTQDVPVEVFCDTDSISNVTHKIGLLGDYQGVIVEVHRETLQTPMNTTIIVSVTLDTESQTLSLGEFASVPFDVCKCEEIESFWEQNYYCNK